MAGGVWRRHSLSQCVSDRSDPSSGRWCGHRAVRMDDGRTTGFARWPGPWSERRARWDCHCTARTAQSGTVLAATRRNGTALTLPLAHAERSGSPERPMRSPVTVTVLTPTASGRIGRALPPLRPPQTKLCAVSRHSPLAAAAAATHTPPRTHSLDHARPLPLPRPLPPLAARPLTRSLPDGAHCRRRLGRATSRQLIQSFSFVHSLIRPFIRPFVR